MMEYQGLQLVAVAILFIAFVCEGTSHGWRSKVYYDSTISLSQKKWYSKWWHYMNVMFIVLVTISVHMMCLGSYHEWEGQFDMYYVYDISWILLRIALARFSIFSVIYNVSRGHSLGYVGESSSGDNFYRKHISGIFPPVFVLLSKFFVFVLLIVENLIN